MSQQQPATRFLVRQGIKGNMVWDRERRGPAQLGDRFLTGLPKEEAAELRDQLERFYATSIGSEMK